MATDIVARGIDVEALDHVVNFDVPKSPADYIHRVGRTARAELTGDAFTFFAPEEEGDIRAIQRAVGRTIERRRVEGFDYRAAAEPRLEVPPAVRIAAHRTRMAEDRARAKAKTAQTGKGSANGGSKPPREGARGPRRSQWSFRSPRSPKPA